MDKGLIKINELEQKINELQKSELTNNNRIADVIKAYEMLMSDINAFEEKNTILNEKIQQNLDAPQRRKKEKKELMISVILGYILTALIAILVVFIGIGGSISIMPSILSSLALFTPICAVAIPIEFKNINKKYPVFDTTKFEDEILSNKKNLESSYSKKNNLDNKLINLRRENMKLYEEISNLQKEIDSIVRIRKNVIEEFCNNNLELDKKLDDAYDKEIVKDKVK